MIIIRIIIAVYLSRYIYRIKHVGKHLYLTTYVKVYITRVYIPTFAGLTEGSYGRRKSHMSWWCLL